MTIKQDQTPYRGDEPVVETLAEIPEPHDPPHPLEEGTVERAEEFEKRRVAELDAEREEHKRRTAGGDPRPA